MHVGTIQLVIRYRYSTFDYHQTACMHSYDRIKSAPNCTATGPRGRPTSRLAQPSRSRLDGQNKTSENTTGTRRRTLSCYHTTTWTRRPCTISRRQQYLPFLRMGDMWAMSNSPRIWAGPGLPPCQIQTGWLFHVGIRPAGWCGHVAASRPAASVSSN